MITYEGKVICDKLFSSADSCRLAASKLTQIAEDAALDGWLINIENEIPTSMVENVLFFLGELSSKMLAANKSSEVIWYDSVTIDGKLNWQNNVNDKNIRFAEACTGIFLNYSWKEHYPDDAKNYLLQLNSSLSLCDVYFGCDIFGRGTAYGGGFCAYLATQAAMAAGSSIALFAPGWLLENCVNDDTNVHSFDCIVENFFRVSLKFWKPIEKVVSRFVIHDTKNTFPFILYFSQAIGKFAFINGIGFAHWGVIHSTKNTDIPSLSICAHDDCKTKPSCFEFESQSLVLPYFDLAMQCSNFSYFGELLATVCDSPFLESASFRTDMSTNCSFLYDIGFIGNCSLKFDIRYPKVLCSSYLYSHILISRPNTIVEFDTTDHLLVTFIMKPIKTPTIDIGVRIVFTDETGCNSVEIYLKDMISDQSSNALGKAISCEYENQLSEDWNLRQYLVPKDSLLSIIRNAHMLYLKEIYLVTCTLASDKNEDREIAADIVVGFFSVETISAVSPSISKPLAADFQINTLWQYHNK